MKLKSGGPLYGYSPGAKYWHRQCERRFFATVSRYDGGSFCFLQNREKPAQPKETILSIKDLVVKESRGLDAVKNLSLDVRAGEVVGIAGIDGNGQTELIQALAGLTKVENGSIHLNEKEITNRKPRKLRKWVSPTFLKTDINMAWY